MTRHERNTRYESHQERPDRPVVRVEPAVHDPGRPPLAPSMDLEDAPTRIERMRRRVLVVDDDEAIRRCIERTLVHYGYHVAVAAGVEDALGRVRTWRPDVLLVDRRLRDGDGLELAGRVRAELGAEAPRVLVCTGTGDVHGWTVLCKPFHIGDLVEAVHRSFSGSASRR